MPPQASFQRCFPVPARAGAPNRASHVENGERRQKTTFSTEIGAIIPLTQVIHFAMIFKASE